MHTLHSSDISILFHSGGGGGGGHSFLQVGISSDLVMSKDLCFMYFYLSLGKKCISGETKDGPDCNLECAMFNMK